MKVRALDAFEHHGTHRPFDVFDVTPHAADQLERKGLVEKVGQDATQSPLEKSVGEEQQSSVSQADQAFADETSSKSKRGGKQKHKSKE